MTKQIEIGQVVRVNSSGDLYMEYEARPYIGQEVTVVGRCRSGLYMVQLGDNQKSRRTFAKRNLDPVTPPPGRGVAVLTQDEATEVGWKIREDTDS
jgi:hypothetical protein